MAPKRKDTPANNSEEEESSVVEPSSASSRQPSRSKSNTTTIRSKKRKTLNSKISYDTRICTSLKRMQYHPEFKDVILFIQTVLKNEEGVSVDELWSEISHKKDKLLTTREGVCTWLQRHGFVVENGVVSPPTRSEVKKNYVETMDFVKSIIVDNVIPPSLAELCAKTSSEVFEIKKTYLQEMFEWEGVSGLKEQLVAQVKNFVPSGLVCEVYVDGFKAVYLGSCVPRADKNDQQKYFAVFGYFCDSPVLIAEERCDFGFRFKYKIPNEPGLVITHWENDERTLQEDILTSPCDNALETINEYSTHPLQSHIENYFKFLQGVVEEEDVSEDSFNLFKSQVVAIITDVKWIIFSTLVKTTHLTASEKLLLDALSDNSELFTKFPVHWLTVICLALGRDPSVVKKYIKNKNKDLLATEVELNWKHFSYTADETLDLEKLRKCKEEIDLLIEKAISQTMTSYPNSRGFITGKTALSDSEDDDNVYDPEPSTEPNHVEMLMTFKKKYTNKHFSYIRTLVCKLINGETLSTLSETRKKEEYFYRFDDISLGRAKYAIPVVNEKDFSKFSNFEYSNTTEFGEGISKETRENVAALKNIEFCDCKKKCGKGCKCLQLQREYRFDSSDAQSEKFQSVRRGDEVYYDDNKRLKDTNTKYIIVECNSECSCSDSCPNRVVQQGSDVKLAIFKTNHTGWGLRAAQKLYRGQFVEIYTGELITDEVGEIRGRYYDRKGLSYLFDVSHGDIVCDFTIDSTYKGNVTRFLNHSCDGNLQQYLVCSEIRDPRYGKIAFFCKRNIEIGEELTFDYHYVCEKQVRCLCGSKNCKQWLR